MRKPHCPGKQQARLFPLSPPSLLLPPLRPERKVSILPGLIQCGHFDTKSLLGLCKTPLQSKSQVPEPSSATAT